MFLHYLNDDSMICDFQLIYNTDCKLHYDFYAYGLLKETEMLGIIAECSVPVYGMMKIDMKGYRQVLNEIDKICSNYSLLMEKVKDMRSSICYLVDADTSLEESMKAGIYNIENMKTCFEAVTNVMAYRRIGDKAADILSERLDMKHLSELGIPSYLIMLQENKKNLKDEDDILIFVKEYGFLSSFDIAPSPYENSAYLRKIRNGCGGLLPMHIDYDDSKCRSDIERLLYGLSWYSELRHIYQLRTLRNFRWYFEKKGMDIHSTGAKELFGL